MHGTQHSVSQPYDDAISHTMMQSAKLQVQRCGTVHTICVWQCQLVQMCIVTPETLKSYMPACRCSAPPGTTEVMANAAMLPAWSSGCMAACRLHFISCAVHGLSHGWCGCKHVVSCDAEREQQYDIPLMVHMFIMPQPQPQPQLLLQPEFQPQLCLHSFSSALPHPISAQSTIPTPVSA